ncbi:MAG: tRNA (adenosine(37)-N6)-threonylcarbamoyltransferase complex dimerization subunit type 1 TsaB [Gemmatimonadetes bacterium]|jgi:tRNA threonylcarbamoyladenosine biosynthesis protein TsaB|nr:tRNA (adenosine(37)-N6)-threonylcarbamoyltransferase complex dimerization subunit type 1 TsaB [Gemmatimonadota bacterium]MBT7860516.1 tRNA (adenosine(37)-N6)-threonylcarbamoyltransferase complex dimerization subunit type 1 TsaB [Gemmatimonadota bacterium]
MSSGTILAIDTATPQGGIALWQGDRLLTQALLTVHREHSKRLFVEIDQALMATGTERDQIAAIAVTIGPGSFTGLRIGLSAAKGLCMALDVPLIPISTLEVLAARLLWVPQPVVCLLDARRGEVYSAVYDTSDGSLRCLEAPQATTVADLLVRWRGDGVLFTGDGVDAYADQLASSSGASLAPASVRGPDAAALAWLAADRLQDGVTADPSTVEPEYLRTPTFVTAAEQAARVG